MEKGLTTEEAQQKLVSFGKNQITTKEIQSPLSIYLSQFPTSINAILSFAAIVSFIIHDVIDSIFIFAIIILNSTFSFIQEYKAEKALQKLKSFIKPVSTVIRDGHEIQIPTEELVPQDIVVIREGERIPADGILIVNHSIEVDESMLTGESLPVIKEQNDEVFSATLVVKGKGQICIQKTGMATRFGEIAQTLASVAEDKTPLQKRLDSLGKLLSLLAVLAALLLIPIGMNQKQEIFPLLLLSISIGVAAIPEGLPAIITVALAIGTSRMAKKRTIIRKMQAIETLGSVQIILIDKTGTLTYNKMQVKKYWVKDKKFFPPLLSSCVLGNTASLIKKEEKDAYDIVGSKTDGALLMFAKEHLPKIDSVKEGGRILDEYVFDSVTKTITTVFEKDKKKYVFVRGAPEAIIEKSKLTKLEKEKVTSIFETYAKEGLRVVGFGTKIEKRDGKRTREELEKDLEFLGFVAMYDPPREDVKQAIVAAKRAGIQPIMVTGDSELTAMAIAKEIGLIEKNEDVVTNEQLKKMSDEDLKKILPKIRVYARTKPEDKLRLVSLFKQMGFVVGVTGDGVNDALALKQADVGVAMGEKGTDVAKEASDIILLDDSFPTLVKAIEEGRKIYNNIVKAVTYLISGNLSEIALILGAAVLGIPTPLLPTQILWINIVSDGLPALALASDNHGKNLLDHRPRNPSSPILSKKRLIFITMTGIFIAFLLLYIFKVFLVSSSEIHARTVVFNLLVIFQMILALIVRGHFKSKPNMFLIFSIIITLVIQFIITTVPFFQEFFHLTF